MTWSRDLWLRQCGLRALFALVLAIVATTPLVADSQTRTVAGTVTDVSGVWTNAANGASINGSCTYGNGSNAGNLRLTNWGFAIPANANIDGIEVTIKTASPTAQPSFTLRKAAGNVGSSKSFTPGGGSCGAGTQTTLGTSTDLWGAAWTAADINAATFGYEMNPQFANHQFDGSTITVYYTPSLDCSETRTLAGTVTDVSSVWTNDTNGASIDGSCTYGDGSNPGALRLTNWGFTLPAGGTVTGIGVTVKTASPTATPSFSLRKAAGNVGTSKSFAPGGGSCGAGTLTTLGGAGDLWGTTWTVAEVNAATFGHQMSPQFANHQFDGSQITVHCTLGTPCTITPPGNQVVSTAPGQCSAVVNYPAPTSSGDCNPITCSPPSGSTFSLGTTQVTCSDGVASAQFNVTVNDTQLPTVTVPSPTVPAAPGVCGANVNFTPTVSDNCPGVGVANCVPSSGSFFAVGATPVNCTVQDGSGNVGAGAGTVTVNDTQPPTISAPPDQTVGTDAPNCSAVVSFAAPTFGDNCPGATAGCVPPSGSTFALGTTTVTCTATDASGNSANDTLDVTVVDDDPPLATAPDAVIGTDDGVCTAVFDYVPGYADNCPGGGTVCAPPSGFAFPLGDTIVSCTATDAAGNTGQDTGTVTVFDDEAPVITCPADVAATAPPGALSWPVSYPDPTVTDNCPGATAGCAPPSGDPFPPGTTTVSCSASDGAGLTAECAFDVTVTTQSIQEIPTASTLGLAALALLLAGAAFVALRRQG